MRIDFGGGLFRSFWVPSPKIDGLVAGIGGGSFGSFGSFANEEVIWSFAFSKKPFIMMIEGSV